MAAPQTYANHRRLEPLQHFIVTPILLITWIASLFSLWKQPSLQAFLMMVLALTLLLMALQTRRYALQVQDRLIRLEETLRMQRLLSPDLLGRLGALSPQQFVGLCFAADEELAERVREALDQRLTVEVIKKRIRSWRPDTFRV